MDFLLTIGRRAELIALRHERLRLGVDETSPVVRDVAAQTLLGYDIESQDAPDRSAAARFIEVKAQDRDGNVVITEREIKVLTTLGSKAFLYVVDLRADKVNKIIQDPFGPHQRVQLSPNTYKMKI